MVEFRRFAESGREDVCHDDHRTVHDAAHDRRHLIGLGSNRGRDLVVGSLGQPSDSAGDGA